MEGQAQILDFFKYALYVDVTLEIYKHFTLTFRITFSNKFLKIKKQMNLDVYSVGDIKRGNIK